MKKKAFALAALLCLQSAATGQWVAQPMMVQAADPIWVESLDRGISAVRTGSGMLVSWRYLANDAADAVFQLYRDNTLIATSNAGEATCFLDAGGNANSIYRVDTLSNGQVTASDVSQLTSADTYFQLPLDPPTAGGCTYSPNDCSTGDVDGDGQYEIFLKWDPSNSQDNSKSGTTGNVYIDCIKLDGTRLWRIDLGRNIRAGAHYTQMLVGDFDSDGSAELVCKTADGTVDGQGTTIGDASADYRNSSGYILSGPEYLTLFDGRTGAALDTIDYNPQRGTVKSWGDSYGNRVDRFLGAVMWLDPDHPSPVTVRGYYTRMTVCAYDVVNKKLVQRWFHDSGSDKNEGYGNGNHNCMPADVDGDGRQELVLGATCIDDDGTTLWCTNLGHGDAMHLGDFLPDRNGLELWVCHEVSPYGYTLIDAATGSVIFHFDNDKDTGRCCAGNVWAGNDGSEFWGNVVYDDSGNTLSCSRPALNFLSYWDGDLEREILDGYTDSPATIKKLNQSGKLETLLSTDGYYTCNTTKGTPCLSADLFGDWREELIVRGADSKSLRIYCTPYETDYRVTTLMHDPQYRAQVAGQNIAYNQPPHASFYLGSDKAVPSQPNVVVNSTEPIVCTGNLMQSITVMDRENGADWSIQQALNVGSQIYGDRDVTYTSVPQELVGAEYVRTACDSKNYGSNLGVCTLSDVATLYVAMDSRMTTVPAWLADWTLTDLTLTASNDVSYVVYSKAFAAGSAVMLGSNETAAGVVGYTVFALNQGITYHGTLVDTLEVVDFDNGADWRMGDNAAVGQPVFGDRTVLYTSLPDALIGAEVILTACDSKNLTTDLATVTAAADLTLYVGLDTRVATVPAWMSDYANTGMTANADNAVVFAFYAKNVAAGETVTLGTNGQSATCMNYVAMVTADASEIMTTTTTTITTSTNEATVTLKGDVDCNGIVNVADCVLLNRYIGEDQAVTLSNQSLANAECDGNIGLTANDAGRLMQFLAKLLPEL